MEDLTECPFCGCAMRFDSNRDTHKLCGDHDDDCVFDEDESALEVPATEDGREWATAAWNRRAALAARQDAPEGWKLVPIEPTEEMIWVARGGAVLDAALAPLFRRGLLANWRQMLKAAPAYSAQTEPQAVSQGSGPGEKL